jgi:hypothetical protein
MSSHFWILSCFSKWWAKPRSSMKITELLLAQITGPSPSLTGFLCTGLRSGHALLTSIRGLMLALGTFWQSLNQESMEEETCKSKLPWDRCGAAGVVLPKTRMDFPVTRVGLVFMPDIPVKSSSVPREGSPSLKKNPWCACQCLPLF